MKNKIILCPLLLGSLSCSILLSETKEDPKKTLTLLDTKKEKRFCENTKSLELIGPSEENIKTFFPHLDKIPLNPEQKFALWVLLHTKLRPDKVGQNSSLRYFKIQNNSVFYKEARTEGELLSFFHGLVPKIKTPQGVFEKDSQTPLLVDEEFERFLEKNKMELWKRPELHELFFKDEQPLKKGESLSSLKVNAPSVLHPQEKNVKELKAPFCSFDPQSILKEEETPLVLGLSTESEHYVAIIDQKIDWQTKADNLFKAKTYPPETQAPFCLLSEEGKNLLLIARETRDPKQLLKALTEKISKLSYTKKALGFLIDGPRQMILQSPTRVLLELRDTNEDPLLHSKDYPLYPVEKLGQIDALLFSSKGERGFVIDERQNEALGCFSKSSY